MLRQRAIEIIDRAQKRARLFGPVADDVPCGLGARLEREREATHADARAYKVEHLDPEQQSTRQQVAQQMDQLRRQHASAQFPEMAAMALATKLAAIESAAATASDASATREAEAVLAVIQQLQGSREFNRSHFAAHFLVAVGTRPTLRAVWRLHTAHIVPIEQLLEAASDASLDAIVQGIRSLAIDELRRGRDDAMILPGLFRELLAIAHTGRHFCAGSISSGKAPDVAGKLLNALASGDEVFSTQPDDSLLIQLKLLRVAGNLASEPTAGSAPAHQLLQDHFLHCLTHPHPEMTGIGSSLSVLSQGCVQTEEATAVLETTATSTRLRNDIVSLFVAHPHLGAAKVAIAVDRVVRREETDWSFLAMLVPKVIGADPSIVPVLLENLRVVFTEATSELGAQGAEQHGGPLGRILSSITLLRFVTFGLQNEEQPDMQAQYKCYLECFRDIFVASGSGGSVKKSVLALVRALTVQVPREGSQYLKLHIAALNPRNNATPAGCREAIKAYISLAKTRLADLGETSAAIGQRADHPDQTSSVDDVRKEIHGYVAEFKRTGAAPRAIFSRFMFRKNWWQLFAEPVLLVPISADVETRSAQRQLIEALAQDKKTKVVREGALETFDLACVAGDDDNDTELDGPGARLTKLLARHEHIWKQWSLDRGSPDADHPARQFSEMSTLCDRIKKNIAQIIEAGAKSAGGAIADPDCSEQHLDAVSSRLLESFCVCYGHALAGQSADSQDDGPRTVYEQLAVFCTAIHRVRSQIYSHAVRIVTVIGASDTEQNTCDGVAMYLALDSCQTLGGTDTEEHIDFKAYQDDGVDTSLRALDNLFGAVPWWKSRAWLHWFLRFGASYTRAVLTACDGFHTTPVQAELRARTGDECAAYLPMLTLLQPSIWLVERTRSWLAGAPPSRVLSRAPQNTSVSVVGSPASSDADQTDTVTDTAAYRWLVADWTELINVLTTLGTHLSLDMLPMESWICYETRLRTCADQFSTPQKLDYLRAQVFEVYLAEHSASAICAAVLRGLLDSDHQASPNPTAKGTAEAAVPSPPETIHCFLLLVQELASLSVHAPSAQVAAPLPFSAAAAVTEEFAEAETPWLLQIVAAEHQNLMRTLHGTGAGTADVASRDTRRLDQLMSYCQMLPPALLWGGSATEAEPTRGLDAVWNFIERALLQRNDRRNSSVCIQWSGAMATHVCRGLFHHCHSEGVIKTVRQWLHARPLLLAALLTPHWRLVFSAAESMLGKDCKEALLGSWETALYAAEGALTPCPPHADETLGVFFSSVAEDPVNAAVALHAVCLRLPTQDDDSEPEVEASAGRTLAADTVVGIVKHLFGDAVAVPCFRAIEGQTDAARWEADRSGHMYELQHDLTPGQRAAVTFVQLLASRCATLPAIQPEQLSSLAYTAAGSLDPEAWLRTLCWRLLASLVETAPWLLLAVGGESSLYDPSGAQVFPSTAFMSGATFSAGSTATDRTAATEAVFLTLAEWISLDELCSTRSGSARPAKVLSGAVALALCASRLSAYLKNTGSQSASVTNQQLRSQQAQVRGAGIDVGEAGLGSTRNRRMVAVIDKLTGALSPESLRGLPAQAVSQLVQAVPHLAPIFTP